MAKDNIYDGALKGILEIIEDVSDSISTEFKGVNPFDKEKISNDDMLLEYGMRGYEIFKELADTKGLDVAVKYRDDMEAMKQRRAR